MKKLQAASIFAALQWPVTFPTALVHHRAWTETTVSNSIHQVCIPPSSFFFFKLSIFTATLCLLLDTKWTTRHFIWRQKTEKIWEDGWLAFFESLIASLGRLTIFSIRHTSHISQTKVLWYVSFLFFFYFLFYSNECTSGFASGMGSTSEVIRTYKARDWRKPWWCSCCSGLLSHYSHKATCSFVLITWFVFFICRNFKAKFSLQTITPVPCIIPILWTAVDSKSYHILLFPALPH